MGLAQKLDCHHAGVGSADGQTCPMLLLSQADDAGAGLANEKTVDIRAGDDDASLVISKKRPKNVNKPAKSVHAVPTKKHASKVNRSVAAELKNYRPDLTVGACAHPASPFRPPAVHCPRSSGSLAVAQAWMPDPSLGMLHKRGWR